MGTDANTRIGFSRKTLNKQYRKAAERHLSKNRVVKVTDKDVVVEIEQEDGKKVLWEIPKASVFDYRSLPPKRTYKIKVRFKDMGRGKPLSDKR
jgi:hypothetical protein